MMRRLRFGLLCLLLLAQVLTSTGTAQGERGGPGIPEFGIGAILYPQGPLVDDALAMAADLKLDWVKVPVAWEMYQPRPVPLANLETLDKVMAFAAQHQISVLLSITRAPGWALTAQGPEPTQTAQFVAELVQRYPQTVQAVELFPGANTRAGWGSRPNAAAYYHMFASVDQKVQATGQPVFLVAAGLQPLATPAPAEDVDDLAFLKGLYEQGASQIMPVISVQYSELIGDPLTHPNGSGSNVEHRVFRHYEEIRRVMSENRHKNGLIWITHLSLSSGTISVSDSANNDNNMQSNWLSQAYIQTRAQLYIGVTIGQSLNPKPEETAEGVLSLLKSTGELHPFYSVLKEMVGLNTTGGASIKPGKAKEGNFLKIRP